MGVLIPIPDPFGTDPLDVALRSLEQVRDYQDDHPHRLTECNGAADQIVHWIAEHTRRA